VAETIPADRLLAFLRDKRSHQAMVVTDTGRVAGLITLEDVIGELLGAVPDEFKSSRLLPLRLSDGRVRLPGALPLERARIWVEGAWPVDNQTVGAFVAEQAGGLPEPGARLTVLDLPVEVESVESGFVTSVIVTPPYLDEEDNGEEDRE
jgi:CBS domain containing-hemolysin-like protein